MTIALGLLVATSASAQRGSARPDDRLRPGISVLLDDQVSLVRGRRVLLVTDALAVDEKGRSTQELLADDRRARAARVSVASVVMSAALPAALDTAGPQASTIVVDIVDHGIRSGSAPRALLEALRGAVRRKLPVIVLDRPNPLTGEHAGGPAADSLSASSDGVYGLPPRHGMTIGEMARWFNEVGSIGASLTVVPVRGWRRLDWPSDRGLDVPRLDGLTVSAEQVILLSSFAAAAATNLRVEVGPGRKVVRVGATWLNPRGVATALSDRLIPGVEFESGRDRFGGENVSIPCVRIELTDRDRASASRIFAAVLATIRKLHPDSLTIDPPAMRRITGGYGLGEAILAGDDSDAIVDRDLANVINFRRRIRTALLYR
jgi:uncharacterized protein YbbC (DUF1343 family)